MSIFNNIKLNKIIILNFLIALIPLSLIIGNLVTNINIILICLVGIYTFGKNVFVVEGKVYYFIYFFFIYLIIITILNNFSFVDQNKLYFDHFLKSLFYLRFLIVFLVLNKLLEKNQFNSSIFFKSCALFALIISIDIIIQFFFKKNIIGFSITNNRPSSFFDSENIAGGYLQKFSLFIVFFLFIKFKNIFSKIKYSRLFIFLIFFIPIILTANRMPSAIFAMSIVFYFFIEKKIKDIFVSFVFISIIIFSLIKYPISYRLHDDLKIFLKDSVNIVKNAPNLFYTNDEKKIKTWGTMYLLHFNTGVQIWKQNKIFGHGLKSFRLKCSYDKNQTCNTHPHNYFIEILVDLGLIGIINILIIWLFGIMKFFKFYYSEKNTDLKLLSLAFFIPIFFEFFPFRSSGSFFTTNNSIYIFIMLAIILNLRKLKILN